MSYPGGPMPTPSYPSAGYDPTYRPSGGTALTAAGLAIPGGLFSLIFGFIAIGGVQAVNDHADAPGVVVAGIYVALIGGFVSGLALLVGAGLIFGGKQIGPLAGGARLRRRGRLPDHRRGHGRRQDRRPVRQMTTTTTTITPPTRSRRAPSSMALVFSIPAIATFILAIVPASGRYLAYRSSGGSATAVQGFGYQAPQQQMYGQQPGYPQQQGFPPSTPGGFPQQGGFQQPGTGGFAQPDGTYPPSDPGGFPQQPPTNPPGQW